MCNGIARRRVQCFSLNCPMSPKGPRSLPPNETPHRKRYPGGNLPKNIPRVVFIPVDGCFDALPVMARPTLHHQSISEPWELMPPCEKDEYASSIPRIPRRQASIYIDELPDNSFDHSSKESSPKVPQREVSTSNFEDWLEEGPAEHETPEPPHILVGIPLKTDGGNKSDPCTSAPCERRQAGGSSPRQPQRRRSLTHGTSLQGPAIRA